MEMIKINLNPVRGFKKTEIIVSGLIVKIDGVDYDLSLLNDGFKVIHQEIGTVSRVGDDYELTVKITHGKNAMNSVRFPSPLLITANYNHEYEAGEF
jgi:uncharacterized protein involved in tellurium resistance